MFLPESRHLVLDPGWTLCYWHLWRVSQWEDDSSQQDHLGAGCSLGHTALHGQLLQGTVLVSLISELVAPWVTLFSMDSFYKVWVYLTSYSSRSWEFPGSHYSPWTASTRYRYLVSLISELGILFSEGWTASTSCGSTWPLTLSACHLHVCIHLLTLFVCHLPLCLHLLTLSVCPSHVCHYSLIFCLSPPSLSIQPLTLSLSTTYMSVFTPSLSVYLYSLTFCLLPSCLSPTSLPLSNCMLLHFCCQLQSLLRNLQCLLLQNFI